MISWLLTWLLKEVKPPPLTRLVSVAGSSLWCTQCTNAWLTTQELCPRSSIRSKRDRWGWSWTLSSTWWTCVQNPGQLHLIEKATGASYHMTWTAAISFFSFSTCSIVDQMRIENVCSLRLHWIVPRRWFVYSCIDLFPGVCRLSKEGQHVLSWTSEGVRRQTSKLWFLFLTNTQIWWHLEFGLILETNVYYLKTLCADRPF